MIQNTGTNKIAVSECISRSNTFCNNALGTLAIQLSFHCGDVVPSEINTRLSSESRCMSMHVENTGSLEESKPPSVSVKNKEAAKMINLVNNKGGD